MRFKLILERIGEEKFIPNEYHDELSRALYRILKFAEKKIPTYIQNQGYTFAYRPYQLFSFSKIYFGQKLEYNAFDQIEHIGKFGELFISFLIDSNAEDYINEMFIEEKIFLGDPTLVNSYQIVRIDACEPPKFKESMIYKCLTPIILREHGPTHLLNFISPTHPSFEQELSRNLVSKFSAKRLFVPAKPHKLKNKTPVALKILGPIIEKEIHINQKTSKEIMLLGNSFVFQYIAPIELQEIGYYCGFGLLNSQGFGFVEAME